MSNSKFANKIRDHFENPRNCGEIQNANGIGYAGKPARGISIKITINVEGGMIKDIKFKTAGCPISIASASVLTELTRGIAIEDALCLLPVKISHALGGIPEEKFYCSELTVEALDRAIKDYHVRYTQDSMNQKCNT